MARGLALAFLLGVADVAFVAQTLEPTDRLAIVALLAGVGLMTFALVAAALYYLPGRVRRTLRRSRAGPALRRGALLGAGVAAVAFLSALHDLQPVTALAVLVPLAALEGVLSTRG